MNTDFFSDYPVFFASSTVGNWPKRLNARYQAMIGDHAAVFQGARVLDIASHDGRWSFAALQTGAARVTGIEVRQEHIDATCRNMAALGVDAERYAFHQGDIFDQTDLFAQSFDVVMCLGFLYHTARHAELLELIHRTGATTLIIDTRVLQGSGCLVRLRRDTVSRPEMGDSSRAVHNGKVLAAKPTRAAMTLMLEHFGYTVDEIDWAGLIRQRGITPNLKRPLSGGNPLRDYAAGERTTFIARRQVP